MARKRDRNSSRKLWYPDSTATQSAESLCATFNSPESPPTSNDIARNLKNTLSHKYCINYYTGHTATKELLESLFNMTKRNMYDMYNESGFLGGWKDRMKYRELSAAKTHIITVSDEEDKLVGFVSFRFLRISDWQPETEVCYIYELQADRQSSGLGTFLINATKIVGRHADAKKLMCTVLKINRRAVSFYRNKCGFVDDESDPSSVDFENREKHIYHILKLELDPPSTSNHDANETDPETSES